ncbi:hypothetical protein CEXT_111691 [Caerostris extrusa]|uniref:Secreted protein n=1 Tax=Caerostris extrusa TaxID=172846 RepID=A0AAV4PTK6_CAEEX|nr:hypothetical protein CEXT_111691 [Caerostris extrusa]
MLICRILSVCIPVSLGEEGERFPTTPITEEGMESGRNAGYLVVRSQVKRPSEIRQHWSFPHGQRWRRKDVTWHCVAEVAVHDRSETG